jgi:YVTN family beta-propeller protein
MCCHQNWKLLLSAIVLLAYLQGCSHAHGPDTHDHDPAVGALFAINGDRSVTLGWTAVEGWATIEYQLYRSTDPAFTPTAETHIATLPASSMRYVDSPLVNNQRYYYRVVPVVDVGRGMRGEGVSEDVTPARPFDFSAVGSIVFSEHVQPIFLSGCAVSGCHVGTGNLGKFSASAALRKTLHDDEQFSLKTWEDIFAGGGHGAVVIPYKAHKSHLVYHINTDTLVAPVSLPHMPLAGFTIPTLQRDLIMRWIDEGGQNDLGEVAFSTFPHGRILATNQAEDLVTVIDAETRLVARYLQAGVPNVFVQPPDAPHNVTLDVPRDVFYVNLVAAGKVLKFRLSDHQLLGEVGGISSPTQVAITSTGDTGYVAQFANGVNAIRLFNTQTMTLIGQVSSPSLDKPHGVQLSPDRSQLWVTGNISDNLMVVDVATQNKTIIPLRGVPTTAQLLPYQTIMTSDGRYVYVSCQQSNEVCVVDRDSMKVVRVIPVGQWPLILAITPDNRFVYVANRNSNDVSVIRTSDNTVAVTIPNVGPQPHGVAIDPAGRYAYVTCENVSSNGVPPHHPTSGSKIPGFVTVIDLTTNTVVKQIEVGAFAAGVAAVP